MKIAIVARHATPPAEDSDPYAADQAVHVRELGEALAAIGHQVVIYARRDSRTQPDQLELAPSLAVRYLRAGPAVPLPSDQLPKHVAELAEGLAAHWRTDRPDVAHAHYWTNGIAALLAGRDCQIPVVQTFGSLGIAEPGNGPPGQHLVCRAKLEAHIARNAAGVLAASSAEAEILARAGIGPSAVRVVPCGTDVSRFAPEGPVAKRTGKPRLVHLGRPADLSELVGLLRAMPDVPAAELVIGCRPGPDRRSRDPGYAELGHLAADLGISNRISFTGPLRAKQLPELLRSADVMVSTARHEPLGVSTIRAMACGTAVVTSADGADADAVIDGTTGLLLPPGRADLLGRSLRGLLAVPTRLAAFGIAAADRARSRYPWPRVAREVAAAFEHFLAASGIAS